MQVNGALNVELIAPKNTFEKERKVVSASKEVVPETAQNKVCGLSHDCWKETLLLSFSCVFFIHIKSTIYFHHMPSPELGNQHRKYLD